MGSRLAPYGSLFATLLALYACAGDDAPTPSTFSSTEPASSSAPPRVVDEPLSGACADEGAVETVRVRGGPALCEGKEAGVGVPDSDKDWRCTCTEGAWRCVPGGSFGAMICP